MSNFTNDGYHLRGQRGQGQNKVGCKKIVTCFLCLKIVRSPHPSLSCDGDHTIPKKDVIDKKALQALFRYLNVDKKDNLQKEFSNFESKDGDKKDETGEGEASKLGASLLLCKGCSLVTGELVNLVEKLELTKIWINHWVRQLVDILSRSTIGPKSRKKKRGPSEDSLASLLRTETKKKCVSKLQKIDFPRVCLERHDDDSSDHIENDKKPSLLTPTDLIKEEHEEEQNRNENSTEDMDMKQPQPHEESNDDIHVEPVVHVKQENLTPAPRSRIRITISCPYCDETTTSNSGLNRHTAAVHPEQFLSTAKTAELSEHQFKSVCQNLLSKLCRVKIVDKKLGCPYCPVTSGNRIYLKAHLIHGHHSILLRKLELLQNGMEDADNPTSPTKLNSLVPQRPKNFYCRYCSKTCITQWSLKRHVLLFHRFSTNMPAIAKKRPRTKLLDQTSEHGGEKVSIDFLKTHQEQCLVASLKELESVKAPELEASKREAIPLDVVSWQCMECEESFATLDQLDSHRNLLNCRKNVKDSLRGFKCTKCEASYYHLASLCRHVRTSHPDPGSRGNRPVHHKKLKMKSSKIIPCRLCGRSFNRLDSLKRHMATACRSVPEWQRKADSPQMLISFKPSSSISISRSQSNSGFVKTGPIPIVVPGNESSESGGYYNEDDYDGDNDNILVPDYDHDPLL